MSAFILNRKHLDYLLSAGLRFGRRPQSSLLRWHIHEEATETDHQRGAPWGPTSVESHKRRVRELTPETVGRVGAMLAAENRRSVDHRYDENELEDLYEFAEYAAHIEPVQVLAAINCYEYQSCEHTEWETSEAYQFCDALRRLAIRNLPGYADADWEIR